MIQMRQMQEIRTHDQVERLVRDLAERWGWRGATENVGIDPYDRTAFGPRPVPYRGDITLKNSLSGQVITLAYELPEDVQDLHDTIARAICSTPVERDRRCDPDEAARPLIMGE